MKFTQCFLITREREDRKDIINWSGLSLFSIILFLRFYNPTEEFEDGRIEEVDKYIRIIILEDTLTIHNAFFDRSFKPNEL